MATKKSAASGAKAAPRAARKPGPALKPAAPAPAQPPAEAAPAVTGPVVTGPVLRKKELFDRVAEATGAKKGEVRQITEAVLDILGKALAAGEVLALPPFGKARVNRQKDLATGEVLIVRLRRGGSGGQAADDGNETLEEGAE